MKCQEMLKILSQYIDGEMDSFLCGEFEKHLQDCNPCQIVIDNIKKTITIFKEGKPLEMPVALQNKLQSTLEEKWREKFSQ